MRRIRLTTTLASTLIVLTGTTAKHHKPHEHHTRGCRTHACDIRVGRTWWRRHHPRPKSLPYETEASWYEDQGETACGFHVPVGVASHYAGQPAGDGIPCGTRVRICLKDRCIVATVQDRGPYVGQRELDLNPGAKDALGCEGVCTVKYEIV